MNLVQKISFLNHNKDLFDSKNEEKMWWFFREQFRFGHREILLDYLNLDYSNLILGFMQHGVHPHQRVGFWPFQELPISMSKLYPVFTWSREEKSLEIGEKNHVVAIGAPWLYLLHTLGMFSSGTFKIVSTNQVVKDLLVVPSHGSGHYYPRANYVDSVKNFRQSIGDVDASVLLYYTEFCDRAVRQAWMNQGFALECSGLAWGAENRTVWTYNGGRTQFLLNTLNAIIRHREVICLAPTSLATYSASLGVPTSIQIYEGISQNLGVVNKGKGVNRLKQYDANLVDYAKKLLGPDYSDRAISQSKIELSKRYLGIEYFRTKDELRDLLPIRHGLVPVPNN